MEIKTEKVNEPSTPTAAESTIKKSVEVSKDVQPKEELKYSQKDLDNITDKVRTTSSKELSSKIEEIQNQFEQYKQQVQRDKMKMTFVQKFGGNEKAFDALVKSNPDLVKSQDFEKDLRILKGTQQFWFDEKSNDNSQNTFENALKTFKKTQDKKFTERNKIK